MANKGLWAEMLTRIGSANTRLARFLTAAPGTEVRQQVEQERSRIALELHSGAGQPLAAIKLHLELLSAEERSAGADERIACLQTLADSALEQVRAVSHRLHPPEWKALPLDEALRQLVMQTGLSRHFTTSLKMDPSPGLPASVHSALYRCAQECFSNVIRHSRARNVSIELRLLADHAELIVTDDGIGMAAPPAGGMGLRAIRHYTGELGGYVRLLNVQRGVTVLVSIPVAGD